MLLAFLAEIVKDYGPLLITRAVLQKWKALSLRLERERTLLTPSQHHGCYRQGFAIGSAALTAFALPRA
jgi:hypothetical protein